MNSVRTIRLLALASFSFLFSSSEDPLHSFKLEVERAVFQGDVARLDALLKTGKYPTGMGGYLHDTAKHNPAMASEVRDILLANGIKWTPNTQSKTIKRLPYNKKLLNEMEMTVTYLQEEPEIEEEMRADALKAWSATFFAQSPFREAHT